MWIYVWIVKYYGNFLPASFSSYFYPTLNIICTRSNSNYRVIISYTNIRELFVKYQGPTLRNNLPKDIRSAKCLVEFKHIFRPHALVHIM